MTADVMEIFLGSQVLGMVLYIYWFHSHSELSFHFVPFSQRNRFRVGQAVKNYDDKNVSSHLFSAYYVPGTIYILSQVLVVRIFTEAQRNLENSPAGIELRNSSSHCSLSGLCMRLDPSPDHRF